MDRRDQDRLFEELDEDGEDNVRAKLAAFSFNDRKKPTVIEWLRRQERERENASAAEEAEIARSAAEANWVSARWARAATVIAVLALVVAVYATMTGPK